MDEKLLQYIWQHKLFDSTDCRTSQNEKITILSVGELNLNSGPDFYNAKILINSTLWVGCVEIHIKASDWYKHNHQDDMAYNNVVLHVVYENDKEILLPNNALVPTLALQPLISEKIIQTYTSFLKSKENIPCTYQFSQIDSFRLFAWLDRMLIDRLEEKTETVALILKQCNQNQEEAFYQFLSYYFGFTINNLPFQLLAKSLPLYYLAKHKNNLFQIESLLFGQAGLLDAEFQEEYPRKLKKEYEFLKQKFDLKKKCTKEMWKFAKTYPSGFPSIRIAQLSALIHQSSALLSKIMEAADVNEIRNWFCVPLNAYWETHYMFDSLSSKKSKHMGELAIHTLIINAVLPFMYQVGKIRNSQEIKNKVVQFYEDIPIENNKISREFQLLRDDFNNAFHSQALIQLKKKYCDAKACLHCGIGLYLLKL